MQYFFILGKNPALSLAELVSVLTPRPEQMVFVSTEVVIFDLPQTLDGTQLLRRLGGTVKMGVVNGQFLIFNFQTIFNTAIFNEPSSDNKFNFGFSYYGDSKPFDEKEMAMAFKKVLKEKGVSSRWVTSREKVLSSVVVEQNKLTGEHGAEVVIMQGDSVYYLGQTKAVQPFKELSKRDYGRPERDDYSGMLPPKVAQMMINLAGSHARGMILDPFCGSGTVLMEATLIGYSKIVGCDKSEKAVADSKQNFQFLISNFSALGGPALGWQIASKQSISHNTVHVFQCDARQLSKKVKPVSVDVIVTEPYLGPARGNRDKQTIEKTVRELEQLYHEAVLQFEKVLKPGGRVVMVWPVFVQKKDCTYLTTKHILQRTSFQKVNILKGFTKKKVITLSDRDTLIYQRPHQNIWREIIILQK